MQKFIINGGKALKGTVSVSGAKNVALKAIVAASLTSEEVIIHNVPHISDFLIMSDIIRHLGGKVTIEGHTARVRVEEFSRNSISLEKAAEVRTSAMFMVPLLHRKKIAIIPNPGGCRIGARPIDRTIEGLRVMGARISYNSEDGYFYAEVLRGRLKGTHYRFEKNTHTGTETLLLAAVLAEGQTVLENAAQEPEVDELITLLNKMGADVVRTAPRIITINGKPSLHGAEFDIGLDRNEIVTFAIAAYITGGDILVNGAKNSDLTDFLTVVEKAGGEFKEQKKGIRFYSKGILKATSIDTAPYPGFMTDWQGPWAVLMTKAQGISVIHETVYENRFGYVAQLEKMGARITLFNPVIKDPKSFYNFNLSDDNKSYYHGAKISGPTKLHNAIVEITDLRAGATLVLASLAARGQSVIFGIEHLDRGYESFEKRLELLGADIQRVFEE